MKSKPWFTIAPVYYSDIEKHLELPFCFDNDVALIHIPEWVKTDEITNHLSPSKREDLLGENKYAIAVGYSATSLAEPDANFTGPKPRTKQEAAQELIEFVNLALWISKPAAFSYELIISAEKTEKSWFWRQLIEVDGLWAHKKYMDDKLTMEDLNESMKRFCSLKKMPRSGTVWIALRSLWRALQERTWEVRFLLLWIALEAIFGTKDGREISYRLSQRAAFFLASDKTSAKRIFQEIKKGYSSRSKVVHGSHFSKLNEEAFEEYLYSIENRVRQTLNKILSDHELISAFTGKNREAYLDALIFT